MKACGVQVSRDRGRAGRWHRVASVAALTLCSALMAGAAIAAPQGNVPVTSPAQAHSGVWTLVQSPKIGLLLDVTFDYPSAGNYDHTQLPITPCRLGLSGGTLDVPSTPVAFQIVNPGGTFSYTGIVDRGRGSGTVSFSADAGFTKAVSALGIGKPTDRQSVNLALFDISVPYATALANAFPAITFDKIVACRIFSVDPENASVMRKTLSDLTPDGLLTLNNVGVTPTFVSALELAGIHVAGAPNLTWHSVVAMKMSGVTSEYIDDMKAAGYGNLSTDDLEKLKMSGVDAAFVRTLQSQGLTNLSVDELVKRKMMHASAP